MTCFCQLIAASRAERCRYQIYHFSWTSARPRVAFLATYQLSHMPVSLLWSGRLQSLLTSLPFNQVCLLHLAMIFDRADNPLLDWKPFTNTFCTTFLTLTNLMKHFYSHVNSMFVNKLLTRKPNKTNKNLQLKSKSVFTKNNTDKAGPWNFHWW